MLSFIVTYSLLLFSTHDIFIGDVYWNDVYLSNIYSQNGIPTILEIILLDSMTLKQNTELT